MVWVKRILMVLGGLALIPIALLAVGLMVGPTSDSTQVVDKTLVTTVGGRMLVISGDYKDSDVQAFDGGAKITIDGQEVLLSNGGVVTIGGTPRSLGSFEKLTLKVENGAVTASIDP